MNFFEELVETDISAVMKGFTGLFSEDGTDLRDLKPIVINDNISFSIKASYGSYCTPRKTVPFAKYTEMEISFLKDGVPVCVSEIISDVEVVQAFKRYQSESVYGYVPVGLIEHLYLDLKRSHQKILA